MWPIHWIHHVPSRQSFHHLVELQRDIAIPAKLHFFVHVAKMFKPFLEKYKAEKPKEADKLLQNADQLAKKKDTLPYQHNQVPSAPEQKTKLNT